MRTERERRRNNKCIYIRERRGEEDVKGGSTGR